MTDINVCFIIEHTNTNYRLGLVWFDSISTTVGYFMPNLLYTYILDIYDWVWFGLMAYQPL